MKPVFVTIEGVDRVGKSTQVERLAVHLNRVGVRTSCYSCPNYDTRLGQAIALHLAGKLKLEPAAGEDCHTYPGIYDALAFQALQLCDKYATADAIQAAAGRGESVVVARWAPSVLVYGEDDGIDRDLLWAMCSSLPCPDLHILLAVDPDGVRHRADHRNRYESDAAKQRRLGEAYARLWRRKQEWVSSNLDRSDGWVVVDGEGDADAVERRVWEAVRQVRPELHFR